MNDYVDAYQREVYDRSIEKLQLAVIKTDLQGVRLRTELLDEPADIIKEAQQEAKRARGINPQTMRKYGLDPRNKEHRRAWANRNNGSGW